MKIAGELASLNMSIKLNLIRVNPPKRKIEETSTNLSFQTVFSIKYSKKAMRFALVNSKRSANL